MNAHTKQILELAQDPHNRNKQLLREIEKFKKDKTMLKANKDYLIAYNEYLEKDFNKAKLSISGWQKSLSEAIAFCKCFDKKGKCKCK